MNKKELQERLKMLEDTIAKHLDTKEKNDKILLIFDGARQECTYWINLLETQEKEQSKEALLDTV